MNILKVSQLTSYQRRRLNNARDCVLCGLRIHDYDLIVMDKRRDVRNVEYVFAHASCFNEGDNLWQNVDSLAD